MSSTIETHTATPAEQAAVVIKAPMKPILLALSALAMMFGILEVSNCKFMVASASMLDQTTAGSMALGFYGRSIYDELGSSLGCVDYTTDKFMDGKFRTGRAFALLTALLTAAIFMLLFISLAAKPPGTAAFWQAIKTMVYAAIVSQLFAFIAVGSSICENGACTLSSVGVLGMFNVFLLMGLSCIMYREAPPIEPWFEFWRDVTTDDTAATASANESKPVQSTSTGKSSSQNSPESSGIGSASPNSSLGLPNSASGGIEARENAPLPCQRGVKLPVWFRLFQLFLIAVAWACSLLSVQRCTFVLAGVATDDRSQYSGLGLFTQAAYDRGAIIGCIDYTSNVQSEFDASFKAARAFGVMTALLMTVAFGFNVVLLFTLRSNRRIWSINRLVLVLSTVTQTLAFAAFGTDTCTASDDIRCTPGGTGIVATLNIFLLFSLAAMSCQQPFPAQPVFRLRKHSMKESFLSQSMQQSDDNIRDADILVFDDGDDDKVSVASDVPPPPARPTDREADVLHQVFVDEEQEIENQDKHRADKEDEAVLRVEAERMKKEEVKSEETDIAYPVFYRSTGPETESISVRVEFTPGEKKTIKEITHPDGSVTVTTTIEELYAKESSDVDSADGNSAPSDEGRSSKTQTFQSGNGVEMRAVPLSTLSVITEEKEGADDDTASDVLSKKSVKTIESAGTVGAPSDSGSRRSSKTAEGSRRSAKTAGGSRRSSKTAEVSKKSSKTLETVQESVESSQPSAPAPSKLSKKAIKITVHNVD